MLPVLKAIHSPDLDEGTLPVDPKHVEVFVQLIVGPDSGPGEESFDLTVVTPSALADLQGYRWGRSLLIVEAFSWEQVQVAVEKVFRQCRGETWVEVATKLSRYFTWEFEDFDSA